MLVKFEKYHNENYIKLRVGFEYESKIEERNIVKMLQNRLRGRYQGSRTYGINELIIYKEISSLEGVDDIDEFYKYHINLVITALYEIYNILCKLDNSINLVFEF